MFADIICGTYLLTLLTNVSVEANSVDPDQTAPFLHCLSERLVNISGSIIPPISNCRDKKYIGKEFKKKKSGA